MKILIVLFVSLAVISCSSEKPKEKETSENSDPKKDLMLNDTLCDCSALDINRDINIVHLSGIEEAYTGWCILYRRGGKLLSKRQFKNGMLNGSYLTYHPNGSIETSITHKDNRYDGWYLKFNDRGDTTYRRYYSNGAAVLNDSIK